MPKIVLLDYAVYRGVMPEHVEQGIELAKEDYITSAPGRGLEIVRGPFVAVQKELFEGNVQLIVRALVTTKQVSRKRIPVNKP